jgi:exonuclease VII small subunit|tara:strand:+ start:490 stop:729 length:240 start_codon:yes stop_codon:yes gene_type:complete
MKSKKIPADIKSKTIKEAQNDIKDIIAELEDKDTNLHESLNKYNRVIQLNYHIQEKFKMKLKEIKNTNFKDNKKILVKE